MTGENKYRVWVEKHESGWISIMAPTEDIARDRAQIAADRDGWYPEHSHSSPLVIEQINDVDDHVGPAKVIDHGV